MKRNVDWGFLLFLKIDQVFEGKDGLIKCDTRKKLNTESMQDESTKVGRS